MKTILLTILMVFLSFGVSHGQIKLKKPDLKAKVKQKKEALKKNTSKKTPKKETKTIETKKKTKASESENGKEISLPSDHPASKDFNRLKMRVNYANSTMVKNRRLNESEAEEAEVFLTNCKKLAPEEDWSWYTKKVEEMAAYIQKQTDDQNANKAKSESSNAEKLRQKELLRTLFDEHKLKHPEAGNRFKLKVNGATYKKNALLFNAVKLEELFEGSTASYTKSYSDFASQILYQVIQNEFAAGFSSNTYQNYTKVQNALGYLEGGLHLDPNNAKLLSIKPKINKRALELKKLLAKDLTGDFHVNNICSTFVSSKHFSTYSSVSTTNFTSIPGVNSAIYIYTFLPSSIKNISTKSRNLSGGPAVESVLASLTIDNQPIYKRLKLPTDKKEALSSSVICFEFIPSLARISAAKLSQNELVTFKNIFEVLLKLSPGKHLLNISYGGDGALPKSSVEFTIVISHEHLKKLIAKCDSEYSKAERMPKAVGSDAQTEARIRQEANNKVGLVKKIVMVTQWTVVKNKYTGVPEYRYRHFEIAYQSKTDGMCYHYRVRVDSDYNGSFQKGKFNVTTGSDHRLISCTNI